MADKIIVIITSGDRGVVKTALMYARNTLKYKWLEDVKIIFFGPSEQLVANDPDLAKEVQEICMQGDGIACKFISDNEGTSKSLTQLGLQIEYVGAIIADFIKGGYIPMVW
ncbi:MAG: hypothetical protein ACFE9D_04970 [Promethearchaeota archaeon]